MTVLARWFVMVMVVGLPALHAHAGEMLLGFNGKTSYQLVTADPIGHEAIDKSIEQSAGLFVDAFAAQGITLPVVREADHDAGRNSIYLGNTRFAREHGVSFQAGQGMTYTWKVVGRNLIVAGNDLPDPLPIGTRRQREAREHGLPVLGTLRSATEFLYRHVGTRFIQPGQWGVVHLPTPVVFVPDDLDHTARPWGVNSIVPFSNDLYYQANGLEPSQRTYTHYGHYHQTAFTPQDAKDHPAYFIFRAGKRQTADNHYCFSNPQVRQRIYQKVLQDCDAGFDIIEMGQSDGFTPCDCKPCHDLYGIHPTHKPDEGRAYLTDPAWGEKLWIMHRDMALDLLKDRPGKKLMVTAYSVARSAPRTIDAFPENVIIQVTRPTAQVMQEWSRIKVPGGFSAYTYTWGSFHLTGYTPLRSQFELQRELDVLASNDMRMLQQGGRPINFGIEGVNIYMHHRFLNDPHGKSPNELFDEYIQAAYQESAGQMASFFRKLHQRLLFMPEAMNYARELNRNPLLLYSTIYTPDLLNTLQEHLDAARRQARDPGVQARLAATAFEFEFVRRIATITLLYHAYLLDPTPETHGKVIDAVESRNNWLLSLSDDSRRAQKGEVHLFPRLAAAYKANGRYMNIEPFNWDVQARRQMKLDEQKPQIPDVVSRSVSQPLNMDSRAWADAPRHTLRASPRRNTQPLEKRTSFQVLHDRDNLYIRVSAELDAQDMVFHSRGRDAELWLQESINIQLSPTGDKSQYFYLSYEPADNSFSDAEHGFITDPLHPRFGWNDDTWDGQWSHVNQLDKANNRWVSMAIIPWKTLRTGAPVQGGVWMFNVSRVHFRNQEESPNDRKNREYSSWAQDLNASQIPGDAFLAPLVFE